MVHTFKFGGQRIAYDNVSGLVLPLSELAYKMLDYIELPMPKECSSALRYDLAKYDSAAIKETYRELYELFCSGKLFARGESDTNVRGGAAIMLGEKICTRSNPHIFDIAKLLVDEGKDIPVRIVEAPENVPAFTDEDVPTLAKQLEKLAKEQVKRIRGISEGKVFRAFENYPAVSHEDEACALCWASKLCSISNAHNVMCELEKKRIECVMMCETSAK